MRKKSSFLQLTMEEYNKRYSKYRHVLLKYSDDFVSQFDQKHNALSTNNRLNLKFDKYLLEGRRWAHINGNYYEIPNPPRYVWYTNLEKKAKAIVTSACGLGLLCVVALPICLCVFAKTVYDERNELFGTETKLVMEIVDVSNTSVVIGRNFETSISVKPSMIEDYAIGTFNVYTYKQVEKKNDLDNTNLNYTFNNDLNNTQTSTNETETIKIKLESGRDYEFLNHGSSLDLVVYSASFDNKLTIDLNLKDISFKYLVKYDDEILTYDTDNHHIPVKKLKTLPEDTSIQYTYNGVTQSDPFEFKDVGEYDVAVEITASGFKTYNKTSKLTIVKGKLTDEQIKDYSFSTTKFRLHDRSEFKPKVLVADGGIPYINEPVFYYSKKGANDWSTNVPEEIGNYEMKAELVFQNYTNYVLQKDLAVYQGDFAITFHVNDDGHWGKKGSTDNKITSQIMITKPTTFGEFRSTIQDYADPWKEGHTFIGWYSKKDGGGLISDSKVITQIDAFDVYAHYTINSYDIETELTDHVKNIEVNSSANYHEEVSVTAKAETGYHIDKIVITGTDAEEPFEKTITGTDRSYELAGTFQMPPSGVVITAYASINNFNILRKPQDDGIKEEKIIITKENPDVPAHYNDDISVSVTVEPGYTLNRIVVYDYDNSLILKTFTTEEGGSFKMPNADVHIQVFTTINSYQVSLNSTDPNATITDATTGLPINYLNVNYKEYLLANLNSYVKVTHPYAKLRGWAYSDDTEITKDTIMPHENVVVKTLWDTYNVHIETVNCSVDKATFNNVNIVHAEDFTITPNTDYHFHHFEYSTDNKATYHVLDTSLPFTPYTLDNTITHGQDIYLKAVCTNKAAVFAFANGGKFSDGTNYKAVETIGGTKFGTLGIEKPTKAGVTFDHWEDMNGNVVNDETIVSDSIIIYAIYK